MSHDSTADCLVCRKHRKHRKHREQGPLVPGGPVAEDELVLVSHIAAPDTLGGQGTTAYLGQLLVEPRRHWPILLTLKPVPWACGARERAAHCGT
jgi:hypothetical protein